MTTTQLRNKVRKKFPNAYCAPIKIGKLKGNYAIYSRKYGYRIAVAFQKSYAWYAAYIKLYHGQMDGNNYHTEN